jgi:hypothetical protein
MTQEQAINRIRSNLLELAVRKYPNDPDKQMLYTIGFLQAQLASACLTDSRVYTSFVQTINKNSNN